MKEKKAFYTFATEKVGDSLESLIIMQIGTIFEFKGSTWIVESKLDDNDFICVEYDK